MELAMLPYHIDTTRQYVSLLRLWQLLGRPKEPLQTAHSARDRFHSAVQRVQLSKAYDPTCTPSTPYGFFHGRPIIGAETGVTGGIYVNAEPREAIVVDDSYGLLRPIAARIRDNLLALPTGKSRKASALRLVVEATNRILRHDSAAVRELEDRHRVGPDRKVALDIYVAEGVGLHRHRALLAAYLLETLHGWGLLAGRFELSPETHVDSDEVLTYTSSHGRTFRISGKTSLVIAAIGRERTSERLALTKPWPGAAIH